MNHMLVVSVAACPACGGSGEVRYAGVADTTFGTPGTWSLRECAGCASLWLDPRPADEALPETYVRYYTHGGETEPPGGDRAKRLLRRLPHHRDDVDGAAGYLGGRPGRALDLGCGDGRTAVALERLGWSVVALDTDASSIEVARARGVGDARVGSVEDLPRGEPPFDAAVLSHVVEHLTDPVSVLSVIREHLVEGGTLAIATPNAVGTSRHQFDERWRGLEVPRHLQVLSPAGLRTLLRRAGFDRVEIRTSARGANEIARQSVGVGDSAQGMSRKLISYAWGEIWQTRVWWALRTDPWSGEELVCLARR